MTLTLELARPAALLALVLPLLLLLASRAFVRPRRVATGTIDVWRRVQATSVASAPRRRPRIPPAVLLLALALALGSLALAGPRIGGAVPNRSWRLLVDGSASMDLPFRPGAPETRRDRAEAMARSWLARNAPSDDVVRMRRPGRLGPEDDTSDAIWITDRAPSPPPASAAWFASGGPSVPGAVAVDGTTRFDWNGQDLVAVPNGAPRRTVEIRGALPRPVATVLDAWAAARTASVGAGGRPSLVVFGAGAGAREQAEASRDGWSSSIEVAGAAPDSDADGPLEAWLADPTGRRLVSLGAGRVHCPWASMEEPRGDPAAFAVSWASLLDRAALPPPGVVALADRAPAGDESSRLPRMDSDSAGPRGESLLPASLACAACLCVAGAWMLSARW